MCCKSKTDDGIVYDEEDFANFYSSAAPIPSKQTEKVEINPIIVDNTITVSINTAFNNEVTPSESMDKSRDILKGMNGLNPAKTKVNFTSVATDQKLNSSLKKGIQKSNFIDQKLSTETNSVEPSTKILILKFNESKQKNVGEELTINSKGLVGSLRQTQAQDGHVFFGHKSDDIDYYLNPEEGIQPKHLEIKFNDKINEYLVNNIKGSGVFIKIDKPFELKDGIIISFGTNHIVVNITNKSEEQRYNTSTIKFKAIYGPNKGKE